MILILIFTYFIAIHIMSVTAIALKIPESVISSLSQFIGNDFYEHAAVVSNSEICTNIALTILSEEGSVADGAIGALLCEGVVNPQSMGLGGGFVLTIYNRKTGKAEVLNAREAAPAAASPDMFGPPLEKDITNDGLSIAVPGELKGYWELHQKYGVMSWYDVFLPTIDLCRRGFEVTSSTAQTIVKLSSEINSSPSLKSLLTNSATNELYREGDIIFRPLLGDLLEQIALKGPDVLYNGTFTQEFLADIQDAGGIITEEDLQNYKATWTNPVERIYGEYTVHTAPSPASGDLLLFILDVMYGLEGKSPTPQTGLFWHRLVETWKFAYGLRTHMKGPLIGQNYNNPISSDYSYKTIHKIKDNFTSSDPRYYYLNSSLIQDHGTSHICIFAPNGDAISVTSTINLSFGSLFVSESTGIILNNEMIDFAIPGHYQVYHKKDGNLIEPNRQPMSSMVPTIVTNHLSGDVRLIIGASGGFKIISSTTAVMLLHLFKDFGLKEAIEMKRLHHQLVPDILEVEDGFHDDLIDFLQCQGHNVKFNNYLMKVYDSASLNMVSGVNAIAVIGGQISAVGDKRKMAKSQGY